MEIMQDIFGADEGETFSTGLVDVESEEAFDVSLGHLYQRWEAFVPGFHKWFVENQADVFRHCLIAPVRELAHLGSPPEKFTGSTLKWAN